MHKNRYILIITILALLLPVISDSYARNLSIIRDEETERFLTEVSEPVFSAAGLNPESVEIVIVNDPSINAFVSGGQKIFINTGLIMQADDASEVIGVIAHEAGHVKSAHLIQKGKDFEHANLGTIAGYVLGLGSVLAGAPPEAGIAISSASQNVAMRNVLSYSRDYENSADRSALNILSEVGVSPRGLVNLLDKLMRKRKLSADIQDKYMLTHPVSEERINHINNYIQRNPEIDKPTPPEIARRFERIKAKIHGFLSDPKDTEKLYGNKRGEAARYAIAIANHKKANFARSLSILSELLRKYPYDPYYKELKAQFLFEQGKIMESVLQYREVLNMLGNSGLIRLKLANALLALNNMKAYEEAKGQLKALVLTEPRNITAIKKLGIAYGKLGQYDKSYLYLAESAVIAKDIKNAKFYLKKAEKLVDKTSQQYSKLKSLKKELAKIIAKD